MGCVSKWYFTPNAEKETAIGSTTVWDSVKTTFRYHLGTAAFGSLIIAIVKTIRAMISYAQRKAKQSNNKVAQAVLCCIQCCLWCIEKCLKFLNKNAYIQTALFSYSFCTAAKKAFFLIVRNLARIAAVSVVGEFIIMIGKAMISVFATAMCYFVMNSMLDGELHSIMGPVISTFIVCYFTSGMFMGVFDMAMLTMLQCFVADEEIFQGGGDFTPEGLKAFVGAHGAERSEQSRQAD